MCKMSEFGDDSDSEKGELIMLLKMLICVCIGTGFGYFTAYEWQKYHKKEICEWKSIEPIKRTLTKDDIRILDWTVKRCK